MTTAVSCENSTDRCELNGFNTSRTTSV